MARLASPARKAFLEFPANRDDKDQLAREDLMGHPDSQE